MWHPLSQRRPQVANSFQCCSRTHQSFLCSCALILCGRSSTHGFALPLQLDTRSFMLSCGEIQLVILLTVTVAFSELRLVWIQGELSRNIPPLKQKSLHLISAIRKKRKWIISHDRGHVKLYQCNMMFKISYSQVSSMAVACKLTSMCHNYNAKPQIFKYRFC